MFWGLFVFFYVLIFKVIISYTEKESLNLKVKGSCFTLLVA